MYMCIILADQSSEQEDILFDGHVNMFEGEDQILFDKMEFTDPECKQDSVGLSCILMDKDVLQV